MNYRKVFFLFDVRLPKGQFAYKFYIEMCGKVPMCGSRIISSFLALLFPVANSLVVNYSLVEQNLYVRYGYICTTWVVRGTSSFGNASNSCANHFRSGSGKSFFVKQQSCFALVYIYTVWLFSVHVEEVINLDGKRDMRIYDLFCTCISN